MYSGRRVYRLSLPALRPLGALYSLLMRTRRALYARGVFASYPPSCPCVSVGNIAFGGSGKTPLVSFLLELAAGRGKKAVVLSRGYGGRSAARPLVVGPDTPPALCGDEPLMLARAHPEATVIVSPRRAEAARTAERRFAPDMLILDDGMQHLALRRDADIVLLRPADLAEDRGRVIPSGPWREGPSALNAATVFAVKEDTGTTGSLPAASAAYLASLGRPVFPFHLEPLGLRPLFPDKAGAPPPARGKYEEYRPGPAGAWAPQPLLERGDYEGRPYLLLSGVGNPDGVERTATALVGRGPERRCDFADHHAFTSADIETALRVGNKLPIVCTPKDAVKLEAFAGLFAGVPVWVLETRPCFSTPLFADFSLADWWERMLASCTPTAE
ncbi:MAG: tetraacyldisaccharide 4'-kinase [Desulfovibrio sp.]|nr:tetraacyldisaccharide 4'-kinase [Desulfovibrio sp.]